MYEVGLCEYIIISVRKTNIHVLSQLSGFRIAHRSPRITSPSCPNKVSQFRVGCFVRSTLHLSVFDSPANHESGRDENVRGGCCCLKDKAEAKAKAKAKDINKITSFCYVDVWHVCHIARPPPSMLPLDCCLNMFFLNTIIFNFICSSGEKNCILFIRNSYMRVYSRLLLSMYPFRNALLVLIVYN